MRGARLLALALWAGTAQAQGFSDFGLAPAQSPIGIVVVDMERLYAESQYGAQVRALYQSRREELAEENRALEAELEAEAAALTEARPTMDPQAFRAEAEAFDQKVRGIRAERDEAEAELNTLISSSQSRFADAVNPILARLMRERGALLLLERPVVGLVDSSIEITDIAIAAVDASLDDREASSEDQ